MRPPVLLGFLAVLSQLAPAQVQPDVAEILKEVSETYKGVSQYEFDAEQTLTLPGNKIPTLTHTRIVFKAPNQYRLEGAIPGLNPNNPDLDETVMIYDGSTLWFYLPKSNQYSSIPAEELASDPEGSAHTPEATDRIAMEKYRVAVDFADGAKVLREDEIEVAGAKVDCYVVSIPEKSPGPYTWWVDKMSHRILREVTTKGSTIYTTIRLGRALPEDLFKFDPPPGARKIGGNQR